MSFAEREPRLLTAEEYLKIERDAPYKSEFWYGKIYAMAGGSPDHGITAANAHVNIANQLDDTDCAAIPFEMKVRASPEGLFAYPDVTVVCGERKCRDRKKDVLLNPIALVETHSPSTAKDDRGAKRRAYQEIESLRDYVLIAQNEPRIEHWARQADGTWKETIALGLDASLALSGIPVTLSLARVYRAIVFGSSLLEDDDAEQAHTPRS